MKASEKWLRERAELDYGVVVGYWQGEVLANIEILLQEHASDVARIDAAETRLEACSAASRVYAALLLKSPYDMKWEECPDFMEAAVLLREHFDRRAAPSEPSDGEMLDYLEAHWYRHGVVAGIDPPRKYTFYHADWENDCPLDKYEDPIGAGPTLRAAIRAAMRREGGT